MFWQDESWEFAPIFRQDQLAENCPVSVQADLRQLYSSVCELIRSPYRVHIWLGDFLTVYVTGISGMPSLPPPQSWLRKPRKCLRRFKSFNLSRSDHSRQRLSAGEVLHMEKYTPLVQCRLLGGTLRWTCCHNLQGCRCQQVKPQRSGSICPPRGLNVSAIRTTRLVKILCNLLKRSYPHKLVAE